MRVGESVKVGFGRLFDSKLARTAHWQYMFMYIFEILQDKHGCCHLTPAPCHDHNDTQIFIAENRRCNSPEVTAGK